MLSRVADNLYWMSRYLERAEHTARLLDVNLYLALEQDNSEDEDARWQRLLDSLDVVQYDKELDAYTVARQLSVNMHRSSSILSCIAAARENARQVRGQLSSEMWEQLNSFYLSVQRVRFDRVWQQQPYEFYRSVKEGVHFFQGITDSTMNHGEGWHFIQLGRHIERAVATATLLDVHYRNFFKKSTQATQENEGFLEWVGLLKSCTAFEAFSKVHTAEVQPIRVAEFLLLDPEFPHSIHFCSDQIQSSLRALHAVVGRGSLQAVDRLAGRLHAMLGYTSIDEVMADNLHEYLSEVRTRCMAIHGAIYDTYIAYDFEAAVIA
ncbi:MAG: alpha-E domain-containing protein [Caldilineales bacterium]|nr:alpha-E domain-containing protein [Caldilineales bacterium]